MRIDEIYKQDKHYPNLLKEIKKPPSKLFARGNLELLNSKSIAIIGSRKCSEYGKNIAQKFSYELACEGITIISGLAIGIDTASHLGAIQAFR